MKNSDTKTLIKNLTFSAMFLAIALLLPLLTGQLPQIGNMMLPMHIPTLLCGLICGPVWGGIVGFTAPLLRNAIFLAPPMPGAISMAFELATYAIVVGALYNFSKWKCIFSLYRSMIIAMISGRVVWGIAQTIIFGIKGNTFTFEAFMAGAFINAVPGIIIQLILIPAIMVALDRTGLVSFKKKKPESAA